MGCSMLSLGGRISPGSLRVPLFYSQQVTPHPSVFLEGAKKTIQENVFKLRKCKARLCGFAAML